MKQVELKNAILNRDLGKTNQLIIDWASEMKDRIMSASDPREKRRVYDQAMQTGEELLYLAHVTRAKIAAELQANSASFLYVETGSKQHHWQIQA